MHWCFKYACSKWAFVYKINFIKSVKKYQALYFTYVWLNKNGGQRARKRRRHGIPNIKWFFAAQVMFWYILNVVIHLHAYVQRTAVLTTAIAGKRIFMRHNGPIWGCRYPPTWPWICFKSISSSVLLFLLVSSWDLKSQEVKIRSAVVLQISCLSDKISYLQ